jgi:hypothetical protein
MASGTADLQRDFGGAIMTSIFGALLTAGYARAISAQISALPASVQGQISSDIVVTLQKSFSSAAALAQQNPQYSNQILAAAKTSFLAGDQWAYIAGIIAILIGAAIVFVKFPKKEQEERLLQEYQKIDSEY